MLRHTVWVLMALFVAVSARGAGAADDLTKGLLLYAPFDESAAPRFCLGPAEVKTGAGMLGEGRVGHGFCVAGNASVSLPANGNFDRRQGTIAFWHLPKWKPRESVKDPPCLLKQSNFQLVWFAPKQVLFFMTGTSEPGGGFHWDYSVATKEPLQWTRPQWRHFAITWDAATGDKRLFLDGRLVAQGRTKWMRTNDVGLGEEIVLGSLSAPGLYDEWAVWDRVLSEAEVARLARQPDVAAKALGRMKPPEEEAAPISFELARLDPTETIVNPGETFYLPVTAVNKTQAPLSLTLHLSLLDVFGSVCEKRDLALDLKPSEKKPLTLDLRADRNGVYKLQAESDWKGKNLRRDLGGFAVWPSDLLKPAADSCFGHHVNAWSGGAFVKQAKRLGLSWQRDHDMLQATWWMHVQPEPGEPKWTNDFQLDYFKQAGMFVLGEFFATPYWAADPPRPKPQTADRKEYPRGSVPQMAAFEEYVRTCVSRHKDYIHAWEVWNEPDCSLFWSGTPEEYGKLAQTACRAAKSVDPACALLVGAFTSAASADWIERAAKAGAFTDADAFSFHGYSDNEKALRRLVEGMRETAKRVAPPGKTLELWDTEWGVTDTTFYVEADLPDLPARRLLPAPSFLQGAAHVVKMECLSMALGVRRSFYYLQNDVGGPTAYSNMSTLEFTRAPRPKLIARTALEWTTRGAKAEGLVERSDAQMTAVVLAKPDGGSLAVVWLEGDAKALMTLPSQDDVELLDLFGNKVPREAQAPLPLSFVPVYIAAKIPAAQLTSSLQKAKMEAQK